MAMALSLAELVYSIPQVESTSYASHFERAYISGRPLDPITSPPN